MSWLQVAAEKPSVASTTLFKIGPIPVTDSMTTVWLILIIIILFCIILNKKINLFPKTFQNIVEIIYEMLENLLNQITSSKFYTAKLFPLIASLIIFIALSNLIGTFVPFLGSFLFQGKSIFRSPTSDFNTTVSLALSMILFIQFQSIYKFGILKHLSNYFKFHEIINGFKIGIGEGVLGIVNFIIGLLDIVSEIARVISLSMRLFGNMFAGEMLAVVLLGGFAYILPATWMTMGILSGFIQAMVFGSLTAAYYMLAMGGEEPEEIKQ